MNAREELLGTFSAGKQERFRSLFTEFAFTESLELEVLKDEADLRQWQEPSLFDALDIHYEEKQTAKQNREHLVKAIRAYMEKLKTSETDYSTFPRVSLNRPKEIEIQNSTSPLGFGRCPCPIDGEKTRCCKLTTLDAVMQCAFACSYCSVQAFYNRNRITVVENLKEKLDKLELPDGVWHIGTGQSSDSLLLGDDYGTLTALSSFARKHPDCIIELKSKSHRNVFKQPYPKNMVFTWSLNAPTIQQKEEHLTATLNERLENAARARDNGNLVGFHIHPMVYFKGWEEEYDSIVRKIEALFSPEDIMMISAGTLIFTKEVLRYLREKGDKSRVLEIDQAPAAGKYSYSLETRRKMFTHLFSSFHPDFISRVFTYLCLEDPSLWMPALGREYASDKEFEMDMKKHYQAAVRNLEIREKQDY